MNLKILAVALLLGASAVQASAQAQTPASAAAPDKPLTAADFEGLRAELRSSMKQMTAVTLTLTDAEATRF